MRARTATAGGIFDPYGNLVIDSSRNREALETLVNLIYREGVSPLVVTSFQAAAAWGSIAFPGTRTRPGNWYNSSWTGQT
jgi:hypothetical protein